MKNRILASPAHYLVRGVLAMLVGSAVWALTFLPLGSKLTSASYLGIAVFLLIWLYCAYASVQLMRSILAWLQGRRSAKT